MTDGSLIIQQLSAEFLELVLETHIVGRAKNTQFAYRSRLDRFMACCAGQPPAPFLVQLRGYKAYLQKEGLAPRTVQAHIHAIKGLLKTAALDETGRLARALPALELVDAPAVRGEIVGDRLTLDLANHAVDYSAIDIVQASCFDVATVAKRPL